MASHVHQALCAECKLATSCTIPGESIEVVLSCGFFENAHGRYPEPHADDSVDSSRIDGICGDCGNRSNCVYYHKREGGTWHCEEYC